MLIQYLMMYWIVECKHFLDKNIFGIIRTEESSGSSRYENTEESPDSKE